MSDGRGEEDSEMGRGAIEKRENAVPSVPKRGASPDFEVVDLDLLEGLPPRHDKVEGGRSEDLSAEGSPPLGAQEPWRDEDGMSLQEIGRARWRRAAGTGNQSGTSSGTAGKDAAGQSPRRNEAEAEHENASFRVFDLSDPPPAEDPWASPPRSKKRAASHGISVAKSRRAVHSTMLVNIDDDDDDDDIVMIASSSSSSRGARGASAAAAASSSSSSAHPGGRKRRPGAGGSKYERLDSNQISTIVVDIADSPDASASSSGGAHASSSSSSSSSSGKRRRREKESQPDDCIVVMERRVEEEEARGGGAGGAGGSAGNDAEASGAGAGTGAGGDDNGIEERAKRARMQVSSTVSSKRGFTCPVCMEDEWEKGTQVRQGSRMRLPPVLLPHLSCGWCMDTTQRLRFALPTLPG
jgi:hypothetical protein